MAIKSKNRLEQVSERLETWLHTLENHAAKVKAFTRLYGVSNLSLLLARHRGLDGELAAVAGLLHDFYWFYTGIAEFHDMNSAEAIRPLLRDLGIFTEEERSTILKAVFHHGDKVQVHGPYEEVVKDAELLHAYLNESPVHVSPMEGMRLERVLKELGFPDRGGIVITEELNTPAPDSVDKRARLADLAETLAGKEIVGTPDEPMYREICRYWPDADIHEVLKNSWCAAFVYYCCREVGFLLPIRYPNGECRFAGCGAWQEWGQLPQNQFFYPVGEGDNCFKPKRGDIIIYEKLLSDSSHDHIGIVLTVDADGEELLVAEGNMDNKNVSKLIRRSSWRQVSGYIRIPNEYRFHFEGSYAP